MRFLKPGVTFEQLDTRAMQVSDNEAAAKLQKARQQRVLGFRSVCSV
ncbi:hypothetical protein BH20PSE1_BH20PSE1_16040 [soil metagenome]